MERAETTEEQADSAGGETSARAGSTRRSTRSRRGGRSRRAKTADETTETAEATDTAEATSTEDGGGDGEAKAQRRPRRSRRSSRAEGSGEQAPDQSPDSATEAGATAAPQSDPPADTADTAEKPAKTRTRRPSRRRRSRKSDSGEAQEAAEAGTTSQAGEAAAAKGTGDGQPHAEAATAVDAPQQDTSAAQETEAPEKPKRRRRPSRRRRSSRKKETDEPQATAEAEAPAEAPAAEAAEATAEASQQDAAAQEAEAPEKPKRSRRPRRRRRPRRKTTDEPQAAAEAEAAGEAPKEGAEAAAAGSGAIEAAEATAEASQQEATAEEAEAPEKPKRSRRSRRRRRPRSRSGSEAQKAAEGEQAAEAKSGDKEGDADAEAQASGATEPASGADTAAVAEAPQRRTRSQRSSRSSRRRRRPRRHEDEDEGEEPAPRQVVANSDIIVNVTPRETRVAILEDNQLVELLCERERAVVGNIYKGRVENVVPALDAAFVDCGIERNVFLHVADAVSYDPVKNGARLPKIRDVLRPGQELLVQVTKGPVESKGARATVRLSLPGRYVVLMRDGQAGVGVSKKIDDDEERHRLRDIAAGLRPEGWGIIVRTRAQGVQTQELQSDIRFLLKTWHSIDQRAEKAKTPSVLYEDLSLVLEILRDVVDQRVRSMVIDDRDTYGKVRRLMASMAPKMRDVVKLYDGKRPIFVEHGIEREIDRALKPRVWLGHGGHISIEETEALTSVDVNSGRFTSTGSLADTVLRTNLEAADEIGRQLRLRDIGGIIVIDFIDMDRAEHRERVTEAMRRILAADRMRTRIMHITRLGLLEMTRKRTDVSLSHLVQEPCPCCQGTGLLLNSTTVATRIISDLRTLATDSKAEAFAVVAEPSVGVALLGLHGEYAEELDRREIGRPVLVRLSHDQHRERFEITPGELRGLEKEYGFLVAGDIVEVEPWQAVEAGNSCLLATVKGVLVEVPDAPPALTVPTRVRLVKASRSFARGVLIKQ